MNQEIDNQLGALSGTAQDSTDYKAKYEELTRRLQTEKVEEGRLRKANEENAALRRELEELKRRKSEEELVKGISEEDRGEVPDEFVNVAAKIADRAAGMRVQQMQDRIDQLEREKRDSMASGFLRRIDENFPGFRSSVGPGGDREKAWNTYLSYNRGSVDEAIRSCNYDALSYHIGRFYSNDLNVPVPSGAREGSAIPDPRTTSGGEHGYGANAGRVYTQQEIVALYEKCEELRSQGKIAECHALSDEIESALQGGRVK